MKPESEHRREKSQYAVEINQSPTITPNYGEDMKEQRGMVEMVIFTICFILVSFVVKEEISDSVL